MWITHAVMDEVIREAESRFPYETGGVLLGYQSDSGECVISSCIGPGPKADHRRSSFLPDADWQVDQMGRLFEESDADFGYLGEWHTHPDGETLLSLADRWVLKDIATVDNEDECV